MLEFFSQNYSQDFIVHANFATFFNEAELFYSI